MGFKIYFVQKLCNELLRAIYFYRKDFQLLDLKHMMLLQHKVQLITNYMIQFSINNMLMQCN